MIRKKIFILALISFFSLFSIALCTKGLTWKITRLGNADNNWLGAIQCASCDPYDGDTECEESLPILCITHHRYFSQPSTLVCSRPSRPCWSGGILTETIPIKGSLIVNKAYGDQQCQKQFGTNSKWASFHDAWGWVSWGYVLSEHLNQRGWLYIRDQSNGNCGAL